MASVSPPTSGRGQTSASVGSRERDPARQIGDRQPGHLRCDLAEGPPVGVVLQRQGGERIAPGAGGPRPEAAAEGQRVPAEVLVEAARPERADEGVDSLSDAHPAHPDRSETDDPIVVRVRQGGREQGRVERRDRLRTEIRGQPLDLFADRRTTKTTYGTADANAERSLSRRRLAWYSIVRRDGGCSTTKTDRSVVPERIQKRQPVGSRGVMATCAVVSSARRSGRVTSRSITSVTRLTRSPSMRRNVRDCMAFRAPLLWSPKPARGVPARDIRVGWRRPQALHARLLLNSISSPGRTT
jgi:hypothetical protein